MCSGFQIQPFGGVVWERKKRGPELKASFRALMCEFSIPPAITAFLEKQSNSRISFRKFEKDGQLSTAHSVYISIIIKY
jgi:hypothetical protein